MNKKILALAIVLVVVLVGAGVAYRALTTDTAGAQVKQSQETSGNSGGKSAKRQAPDFSVLDAEGKQVLLSSLRGKPVVLNFNGIFLVRVEIHISGCFVTIERNRRAIMQYHLRTPNIRFIRYRCRNSILIYVIPCHVWYFGFCHHKDFFSGRNGVTILCNFWRV